jgi:hypothetical protein
VVEYFKQNTCRIEVLDAHDSLQRVYFAKPIVCNYITSSTRDKVRRLASRGCCRMGAVVTSRGSRRCARPCRVPSGKPLSNTLLCEDLL